MPKRKTDMEVLTLIKEYVQQSGESSLYKSQFRKININPETAAKWCKIIAFCQASDMPRLKVTEIKRNVVIEILNYKNKEKI